MLNPLPHQFFVDMEPGRADRPAGFFRNALPRGLALFLGGFSLINVLGGFRSANLDANLWWIDLRSLPSTVASTLLLFSAVCLIAFAFGPPRSGWRRALTLVCVIALALAAAANTAHFYVLLALRTVVAGIPIPLSLFVAAALAVILAAAPRAPSSAGRDGALMPVLAVCLGTMMAFPVAQMFFFGNTDYRRPADVAVVLGARVYADGRPSDALADRVRTGCQLYRDGLAKKLIMSGGPGDGPVHETEAMRRLAIGLGVKPEDIVLDPAGVNTQATVSNTRAIFSKLRASRVLVVSHFYHLPRIKMAYQRAGLEIYTVPARQTYVLRQIPYNMLREVAALWVYYLRPWMGR